MQGCEGLPYTFLEKAEHLQVPMGFSSGRRPCGICYDEDNQSSPGVPTA